jgi:hypothetical protein
VVRCGRQRETDEHFCSGPIVSSDLASTRASSGVQLATSASLVKDKPVPAFVFALVFAADGAGVAAYVTTAPAQGRGADVGS